MALRTCRNVVTLKDTQSGLHEVFIYKPTPEDEEKARKKWQNLMEGFCEAIFGHTAPDSSTSRYGLWQRQHDNVKLRSATTSYIVASASPFIPGSWRRRP